MAVFKHIEKILLFLVIAGIVAYGVYVGFRIRAMQQQEILIAVKSDEIQRFLKTNDVEAPKREPEKFSRRVIRPWTNGVPNVPPFRPWSFYVPFNQ